MTAQKPVRIEHLPDAPEIAVVSLNRPAQKNAITDEMIDGLMEAASSFHEDSDTKVIVLRGEGGFFSAGADVSTFDAIENETDVNRVRRMTHKGGRLCTEWETLPQLTIASITGGAVGGGLALALASDWRVMAEDAWVYVPEARLGLIYGWNTVPRLTRLIGPARTKTLSILCRRHSAAECDKWGLTDKIAKGNDADKTAFELAREACSVPRLAAQLIKRSTNAASNALSASTSYADMDDMLVCMTDPEGNAARQAFIAGLKNKDHKLEGGR
ncbi:enoyl-CoA hydratase/isomerase family protein [Hoeflea alexandrii]|uniref:enoyl-CoA hydratase/isomerase family protein n=1 Tax=Hoeflea alexandrii TaxID=288436 RepID=UPI0022AEF2E3|nr:enoyl-CoA hydratase/isomerase family protein [Hoeflea alexandrii]MCZ4287712.1 enoyl-CoA hydratase/isomerase family protein [Hoeflea alexandrii]